MTMAVYATLARVWFLASIIGTNHIIKTITIVITFGPIPQFTSKLDTNESITT